MATFLFTVTFTAISELPADNLVNTWHFEGSGSDFDNVGDMLEDFYTTTPDGQIGPISDFMTSQTITGDYTMKAYDLSDPKPRAPQWEETRTLVELPNAAGLPDEVALVMSYHASPLSGVSAARRRGRVYLGGLASAANVVGRPATAFRTIVAAAGRDLIQASNASTSWDWVQYSPTANAANTVVGGWVDDSWDTQRRRGRQATSRVVFTGGVP